MKSLVIASFVTLLATGSAFAAHMTSGRPSAVLNDTQCQKVWSLTEREGDTLSQDKAHPFIVNFKLVDVNGDGKITWAEFKKGCTKGLVSNPTTGASAQ